MSKNLRHFLFYTFSIFIVLTTINSGFSQDKYWVNGTGDWNDINHWSEISGGNSGASIPTETDNVIFDNNSFTSNDQTVLIRKSVICKDFNWSVTNFQPTLKSKSFLFKTNTKAELQVYGSLIVNESINNEFFGDIILKSSGKSILQSDSQLEADIIIDAKKGEYGLAKDFITEGDIYLKSGTFNTNDYNIETNAFVGSGSEERKIILHSSEITTSVWDFEQYDNLDYSIGDYKIIYIDKKIDIKAGIMPVTSKKDGTKGFLNWEDIVVNSPKCNAGNDGSITVSVKDGSPNYIYTLHDGPTTSDPIFKTVTIPDTVYTFIDLEAKTYRVVVEDNNGLGGHLENPVVVTEPDELDAGSVTVKTPLTCYDGNDAELEANPLGGTEPYTYQWLRSKDGTLTNWDTLSSASSNSKILSDDVKRGIYRALINDANGCGDPLGLESNFAFQKPPLSSSEIPDPIDGGSIGSDQFACYNGDPVAFTNIISASGGSGIRIYDWEYQSNCAGGWTLLGVDSETYDIPAGITETRCYRRSATNLCGTVYSDTVTITVYAQLDGGTIGSDQTICYNTSPAGFTDDVSPSGGTGLTYQWEIKVGAGAWTPILGATGLTYTELGLLTETTMYRRVSTSGSGCGSINSNEITITLYGQMDGGSISNNQTICYGGDPASFNDDVSPSGGNGAWTYDWEYQTNCVGVWTSLGVNNLIYDIPNGLTETRCYRRVASNDCDPVYSNEITVTVYGQLDGGTIGSDETICYNTSPAGFTDDVSPSGGTGLTYQWEIKVGAGAWTPILGATGLTYTELGLLTETTMYRRVTTSGGGCGSINSNEITITVYGQLDGGTIGSDETICYNTSPAGFTDDVSPSGGTGLSYQWEIKVGAGAWTPILGATGLTYTELGLLTETTMYRRVSTSGSGCGSINSNEITITVYGQLDGGTIGSDETICYNSSPAEFTDDVSPSGGTGLSYQWEIKVGAGAWTPILGATGLTYTELGLLTETTMYRRVSTSGSGCGSINSNEITVTVLSELLVAIGKPTPFLIDSTSTHIDVYVDINHNWIDLLGVYLVSPLDSVVELKPECPGGVPGLWEDSVTNKFYNDPLDSAATLSAMDGCNPISGRFKFSGEWKKKLHGQDPANGSWRIRIIDYVNWGGVAGYLEEATITFSDTNAVGVFESVLYSDSTIHTLINKNTGANPTITDFALPITGLTTSCFGICDAKAVATASGGQPPYNPNDFKWSTSLDFSSSFATGDTVVLCVGKYYVQVTDSHGCTAIDSVSVGEPPEIYIIDDTVAHNICNGYADGKVMLEFAGGRGALKYTYDGSIYHSSGDRKSVV